MKIIVHGGRAHEDDFLAACVCLHKLGLPLHRTEATEEMLADPECWVLDQGMRWEPELHNFDHHQMEREVCALTLVLDHFYGGDYRELVPGLRFIEIQDSYGASKAAEFAGIPRDSLKVVSSPIRSAMLKSFSRLDGRVGAQMTDVMSIIGAEVCRDIEEARELFEVLTSHYNIFERSGIKVLDTTRCVLPEGCGHDRLPTKAWCRSKGVEVGVILTKDTRKEGGYRMVSVNTDDIRFLPNDKAYFTHVSGFLTGFGEYVDHEVILDKHVARGK